jgi:predicted kinase
MCGLPGSGKSTAAYQLLAESQCRMRRVSMDDLRAMLDQPGPTTERPWSRLHEQTALAVHDHAVREAVLGGWDVVVDNCNVTPYMPERLKDAVGALAQFVVHDLTDVPVQECIRRDAERPWPLSVDADVILGLARQHTEARATGWQLTDEWMNDRHTDPAEGARYARQHLTQPVGSDV